MQNLLQNFGAYFHVLSKKIKYYKIEGTKIIKIFWDIFSYIMFKIMYDLLLCDPFFDY